MGTGRKIFCDPTLLIKCFPQSETNNRTGLAIRE